MSDSLVPETRVLAVASQVVYGYVIAGAFVWSHAMTCKLTLSFPRSLSHVGNSMATFTMQSLGCDVAALNTVHFSNHTGYRQFKGTRATAQEITDLYQGLCQSNLIDFDVMLSGYAPSAAAVEAVGAIGIDLQQRAENNPGDFFWVLDPVMGDQGRLYVNDDVVPAYKKIIHHADLILPNQFEAEVLSGIKITSLATLAEAITAIHRIYSVPHVIITSVQLFKLSSSTPSPPENFLTVIGSTTKSDGSPRLFRIDVPALDCFFSGTGDMFAALMVARLREAVTAAGEDLRTTRSWVSPDSVASRNLPLARATAKVLSSMHSVLERTLEARDAELKVALPAQNGDLGTEEKQKWEYLRQTKAAEIRLVRNVQYLRNPIEQFEVQEWCKEDLPAHLQ
ncbi:Phosphomethylpyrimidine kinase type-1 [Penicillium macrosclerotiorum]|uniref:Phosphomethylpyrimidine kinase type-1 n=1 Tax=Penicillium macrosclerotiorum TaxID=303699 RepID=UPI0025469F82|nr:Phosphomethylpyrimidine kinase type-1 [Penicillium macrosclerotiorum]KAJ5688588.1 Phosphomethylpyrimidine kinase type-1 [Penicillium macrosclerotiorum]